MFFQGTLQEAIAAALQQSKFVVCFVTDDGEESQLWESEFLNDESLNAPLRDQAVTLKLQAGSVEAGYLAAIFPLPKAPTIVIIKDGKLKEYLASGASKEDFISRTLKAFAPIAEPPAPPAQTPSITGSTSSQTRSDMHPAGDHHAGVTEQPMGSSDESQPSSTVQQQLVETATRLGTQRENEAKEAEKRRLAKAADETAGRNKPKLSESQVKYAEEIKQRRRQAQEERNRILKAIEDDKAARKARKAAIEAEKKAAREGWDMATPESAGPSSQMHSTARAGEHCSLQVRLLDGSTIRCRFSSASHLGTDVRKWVDESANLGKTSYTFKVVLSPLPNKAIDPAEEDRSLQELGLAPSSTLVLVPSSKPAAAAYLTTSGNPVSRFLAFIVSMIMGFITMVSTFFITMFRSSGPENTSPTPAAGEDRTVASGRDEGLKGPGTQRERRHDQQFYNGNSTNFEPRKDDDEE